MTQILFCLLKKLNIFKFCEIYGYKKGKTAVRSHFLSKKSLIAAENETKEKRWTEEEETHN